MRVSFCPDDLTAFSQMLRCIISHDWTFLVLYGCVEYEIMKETLLDQHNHYGDELCLDGTALLWTGPPLQHNIRLVLRRCCCGSPMVDSAVLTSPLPSFVTVQPAPARDQPPHWLNEAVKLETFIGWEKAALELHLYTRTSIWTTYPIELIKYWICASLT